MKKSHNLIKCKHCGEEMEKADLCEGCGCCVNLGTIWDDWGCCSCEWDEAYPFYARNRGQD